MTMVDCVLPKAAKLLLDWSGVVVSDYRLPLLKGELDRLAGAGADGADVLLDRLECGDNELRAALFHAVSVSETYLFRHPTHFTALRELADKRHAGGKSCHVLSAGASTGEEVWSAAAVLASVYKDNGLACSVTGWELDAVHLHRAELGRFAGAAVREGFGGYDRLFHQAGEQWLADDRLRRIVRWQRVNLVADALARQCFDAVFFRNVSIYWLPAQAASVTDRLCERLAPDGLLMLGPSDQVSLDRRLWRRDPSFADPVYVRATTAAERAGAPSLRRAGSGGTRQEAIPRAAREVQGRRATPAPSALSRPLGAQGSESCAPARQEQSPAVELQATEEALARIQQLANRGNYAEALRVIDSLPSPLSPATLLWRGILLLSMGQAAEAARIVQQCVFLESENPVFRHWLAVCLEQLGFDVEAARERRAARQLEESA